MRELDQRVALLRLFLADIADRERRAHDEKAQLRGQIERAVDFTVRFNGGVANALATLADLDDRAVAIERMLHHLALLRQRARGELDALLLTRGIADARARLTELETQRKALAGVSETGDEASQASEELAAVDAEIADLRAQIQSASEAAARALAEGS